MTKTFNELFPHKTDHPLPPPTIWKRIIRVLYDTTRGFIEDDCYAKASALTFYALLSVVPVLAVLFGVAKGFGFEKALELEITERFQEQPELTDKLIQFAYSWLHNVQGGIIAGIGTLALFWSVLGLLSNIETALNDIWKIPISRSIGRRISDYLATMVICPIFLVTSSSITLFLSTQIAATAHSNVIVEVVSPFLLFLLKLFPFFLSWVLFTFVYLFMPNTKVYLRSAIIAGILAGTAFQAWQWIYIKFQIGASSYGAIYGSFAALPLFLIWIQVSWLVLLAGAELAFEIENDLFIPYRRTVPLSSKAAALLITYRCIEAFALGNAPHTDRSLAHELGISLNHLHTLLEALQTERILSAVSYKDQTMGYQPARAIESITFTSVCNAIDKNNVLMASVRESETFQQIQEYLKKSDEALERASFNHPIYLEKTS
jgi:membrane protein